jgi:cell division protein FtsQ
MTAASIKRGGAAARKPRPMVKRKGKAKPSMLARAIDSIPISAAAMQRVVTFSILGVAGAAILAIAMMLGLPAYAATQMAEVVGGAGFAVKRVEVTGIDRMDRLTVYAVALDQKSRAMPLVDLDKVRDQLLQYGWIADARVSRRLPDTLVVDIVERKAAAVWQHAQQLSLIDDKGVVLEPVALNAMPDLPLLIGPDANVQATALSDLMNHAPRLKPMLAGATWVGNRRWDLRFQSGEVLALPEGDALSAKALVKFSAMDGLDRLLGRGFVRFDMRDPAKMFVRVSRDKPTIDKPAAAASDNGDDKTPSAEKMPNVGKAGTDKSNEGGIA